MTHKTPDADPDLRRRFLAARRADAERAPSFRSMMSPARVAPRRTAVPRRLLVVGSAAAVAASAIALAAIWVVTPSRGPGGQNLARLERTSSGLQPRIAARVPIPEPPPPAAAPQREPAGGKTRDALAAARPHPDALGPAPNAAPGVPASPDARVEIAGTPQRPDQAPPPSPGAILPESVEVTALPPVSSANRFYQTLTLAPGVQDADGGPNVHGSRQRDLNVTVSGIQDAGSPPAGSSTVLARSVGELPATIAKSRIVGRFALTNAPPPTVDPYVAEEPGNTESYQPIDENDFLAVADNPLSTFSVDVDTASYSNVRRFLQNGNLPPRDAVRIEELVNYFHYDYPAPVGDAPFEASIEIADCPWNPDHRLARIGIKGRELERGASPGSNLVFLIDVSGSMNDSRKLPLLKSALALLVEQLTSRDRVSIVVYAGSSGLALAPTSGDAKVEILDAIENLEAGGSTNGGAGMALAYRIARENFVPGGVNRVILATDGDFNVGVTSRGALLQRIEDDAENGIFLTALGFGYGNLQDDTLEHLADRGNGNYAYIDRLAEARKVLVEQMAGTLVTIAKDVKIQVEFNPLEVGAYRLIGYENRLLKKEDFNDDRKDAGEIGAGHTVTALYELAPPAHAKDLPAVDPLKYQSRPAPTRAAEAGELFTLRVRYKDPDGQVSRLLSFPVVDEGLGLAAASADFKFAAAVAELGLLLRGSDEAGDASFDSAEKLAAEGLGADERGLRAELLDLIREARKLAAASGGS